MIAPPLRMADTPPLVSFRDVRVDRGGRAVLTGVTADVPRGGITALVGLNGSGKSTLLRAMLGELPHRGQIIFRCGHDHSRPRPEYVGKERPTPYTGSHVQSAETIEKMRIAGRIAAQAMQAASEVIAPGVSTDHALL